MASDGHSVFTRATDDRLPGRRSAQSCAGPGGEVAGPIDRVAIGITIA